MTRRGDGGDVRIAATCLENWDMYTIIKLLQTNIFSDKVHRAVNKVKNYTRTDLAHERLDCDWVRDCGCMVELLDALGLQSDAGKLREFCKSKNHSIDAGNTYREVHRT